MTLVEDYGMDVIELITCHVFKISDSTVDKELKMLNSDTASMNVV